jgi:predicted Fe-S protein YdhL (DUF1289 family)
MSPATSSATPAPTPSPCVSLCKIDQDTGLCEGCWRSIDEIIAWGTASETIKREIWQKIQQRKLASGDIEPQDQ